MKITGKTTKEQLIKAINANYKKVTDKVIKEQIAYTSKAFKKDNKSVTKSDLAEIVKQMMAHLGSKFVEPAMAEEPKTETQEVKQTAEPKAENSLKPSKKGAKKTADVEPSESKEESKKDKGDNTPKKTNKDNKKKSKESGATVLNKDAEDVPKAVLLVEAFKENIELPDDDGNVAKYEIAHDIQTMDDLYKALEDEETIVFAMYWSERLLKQFPYFNGTFKAPKSFPLDLDLATCIYVSESGTCAYPISMYTEGMYLILPEHLPECGGLRYCNGIEYQIYRQVE